VTTSNNRAATAVGPWMQLVGDHACVVGCPTTSSQTGDGLGSKLREREHVEDCSVTDQEWLKCTDRRLLMEFVITKASNRKRRLFAVACCHQLLHLDEMRLVSNAIDAAERCADGLADADEVMAAEKAVKDLWLKAKYTESGTILQLCCQAVGWTMHYAMAHALLAASTAVDVALQASPKFVDESRRFAAQTAEMVAQCNLLRDIFQFTLQSFSLDRTWQMQNAVMLANLIYDERAFNRLPILADALEDAGCDSAEILAPLRRPGPHVRGCWALDLILGKE
jgi:hypothetical protein